MAHKLISKAEAKKQGLKTYYTGKPCTRGHSAPRYVNSDKCIECHAERNKRRKRGKAIAPISGEVLPPADDWQSYADRIAATWQEVVESIIATGRLLIEAKAKLKHGEFGDMMQLVPFGERTAQMLMAIAANPVLSNTNHGSVLPPSWRTLYELSRFPDDLLLAKIEDHTINPDMQRKDIKLITDETGERNSGKRAKPRTDERIIALNAEIENLNEHVAELEAARDTDAFIDTDDESTLARKIVMVIGKERAALLIVELQILLGAASEAAA